MSDLWFEEFTPGAAIHQSICCTIIEADNVRFSANTETHRKRSIVSVVLAAAVVALTHGAQAQTVAFHPHNWSINRNIRRLPVHVGGRVMIDPLPAPTPPGAMAYVHQWPGVYFETGFKGSRLTLEYDDPLNEYRLSIDGLAPITLAQPGKVEVSIGKLEAGTHRVRLEKVTESVDQSAAFEGFYISKGERPIRVEPRARAIEFIGDSGMTGYGIRSSTRKCTKEEVRLRTDTQLAYPALVAKSFNADYQINAVSGRGLVRNYGGTTPDFPMSRIYRYTLPATRENGDDRAWRPQIVVIVLYGNDFSTDLHAGEKWRTLEELIADYVRTAGDFLAEVHQRTPDAAVLMMLPDLANETDPNIVRMAGSARRTIVASARAAGIKDSLFPGLPDLGFEDTACDYHASIADHRKLARWMTDYIEARPYLWQHR